MLTYRRHQDDIPADERPDTRHGGRDDAIAAVAKLGVGEAVEAARHLVEVGSDAVLHHLVIVRPEIQQHGLLDPLVRHPRAVDFFGDPQLPGVEPGEHLLECGRQLRLIRGRRYFGAPFEGGINDWFERMCRHRHLIGGQRQNSTMRRAASTQSFNSGTRAIRTYPRPGFTPWATRPRY